MDISVSSLLQENAGIVIAAVTVLLAFGFVQWRRARQAEEELSFKMELLERGLSVDEIERLLRARPLPNRTLLGQFAALSGWAKAGVILAVIVVTNMVFAGFVVFTESKNRPRYYPPPAEMVRPIVPPAPPVPPAPAAAMPAEW